MIRTLSTACALALAACTSEPSHDDPASEGAEASAATSAEQAAADPDPPQVATGDDSEDVPTNEADDGGSEPARDLIPPRFQGRWALVAGDCTSTRGDAKGLMTIYDDRIRFYESLARLKERRPAISGSFSGEFDFTGEGQQWSRVMTFTRDGNSLRRSDSEGDYTYRLCPAAAGESR